MLSDNYKCIQGYECLAGCISNYFNYYNIGLNESDIFLCGDGFRIEYSGDLQYLRIGTKAYEANRKFINKYKIPCKKGFMSENSEAKEMAEYCIGAGIPLIVRVDTGNLSYHSVYHNSPASPHWINVIGSCRNGYIISDCAIPALKRENIVVQIMKEELLSAWKEMRYEYIILSEEGLYSVDMERIKHDSVDRLRNLFEEYLRPKKKWLSNAKQGINAVASLLDDITDYSRKNAGELNHMVREINYQVKINGIVSHRYVIKMKLKELGYAEACINEFDGITDRWNNLFFKLLRAGMTGRAEGFEKIRDESYVINEQELENINKILQSL